MNETGTAAKHRGVVSFMTLTGLIALVAVSTDMFLPGLPAMTTALGASVSQGQLTLSLFMLGVALGQLLFGPLSDQLGRLPVARAGVVAFIFMSLLTSLAWTIESMWVGRILQGVAASSGAVVARAMIRDLYEGHHASRIMALTSASMALVPVFAPSLGAYVTLAFSWRFTLVAQAVFGVAVLAGLSVFRETARTDERDHSKQLTLKGIVSLFKHCLSNPLFLGYQLCGTFSFCGVFIYISTIAFFLNDVFSLSTQYFGVVFAVTAVGFIGGNLASSWSVSRWGPDNMLSRGAYLCAVSAAAALAMLVDLAATQYLLIAIAFTFFFGVGLIAPNASMGAISLYPHKTGAASAVYGSIHSVSSAAIGGIAGALYSGRLLEPVLLMFLCTLGALIGIAMIRRYRTILT